MAEPVPLKIIQTQTFASGKVFVWYRLPDGTRAFAVVNGEAHYAGLSPALGEALHEHLRTVLAPPPKPPHGPAA